MARDRGVRDEDLVPVASVDELEEGMTVVVKTCAECDRRHQLILLGLFESSGRHQNRLGVTEPCAAAEGWRTVGGCLDHMQACFCYAIREGRLFRIRPTEAEQAQAMRALIAALDPRPAGVVS